MNIYGVALALEPTVVITTTIAVVNIFIGFFIFFRDIKSAYRRQFFLFSIFLTTWIMGLLIAFETKDQATGLFGLRLAFLGASLLGASLVGFSFIFPKQTKFISHWSVYVIYLLGLGIGVASIGSDLIVNNISLNEFGYIAMYGGVGVRTWA